MGLATGLATYTVEEQGMALTELVNKAYSTKLGLDHTGCFMDRLEALGLTFTNPTEAEVSTANTSVFDDVCDDFDTIYAAICAGTWEPPVT